MECFCCVAADRTNIKVSLDFYKVKISDLLPVGLLYCVMYTFPKPLHELACRQIRFNDKIHLFYTKIYFDIQLHGKTPLYPLTLPRLFCINYTVANCIFYNSFL